MSRRLDKRRKFDEKREGNIIAIYTEGTVTEPQYFSSIKQELRLTGINIEVIGKGYDPLTLVEHVCEQMNPSSGGDEWWVVFDRDEHENFNKAIQYAESRGLRVAYSNESFELWFLLHFEHLESALDRTELIRKLEKKLRRKYEKSSEVYTDIKNGERKAIRSARLLEKMHNDAGVVSYKERSPSTTVFKLVERLREL